MKESLRILIVDDDPIVREALSKSLRVRGHEVIVEAAVQRALAAVKDCAAGLDVVISDFNMPDMDGLAFLQLVRLHRPDVLRVLLTGEATTEMALRALNERAAHRLLQKPWNRVDLDTTLMIAHQSVS